MSEAKECKHFLKEFSGDMIVEKSRENPFFSENVFLKSFRLGTDKLVRSLLVRFLHKAWVFLNIALIEALVNIKVFSLIF